MSDSSPEFGYCAWGDAMEAAGVAATLFGVRYRVRATEQAGRRWWLVTPVEGS